VKNKLSGMRAKLPAIYQQSFFDPLMRTLDSLTADEWAKPNWHDFLRDLVQAVIQQAENFEPIATDAFQELISDIYDGFLSAEDRAQVKLPDFSTLPPLVRWGSPQLGPYTYAVGDWMADLGFGAGLVSLPPANSKKGLMAWATLPHETAGHDVLGADKGLSKELEAKVKAALLHQGVDMAKYWAACINEAAADVLGVLNAGPAAAIGLIAYFRGISLSVGHGAHLDPIGEAEDTHPADLARAYLAAASLRVLHFTEKNEWARRIEAEADAEPGNMVLAGKAYTRAQVKKAVKTVVKVVLQTPMLALENHRFDQIQNWKNTDEEIVAAIRGHLLAGSKLAADLKPTAYATHVMAAAVMNAVFATQSPQAAFAHMLPMLKQMHDDNPSWGPIFLRHPGNLRRHYFVAARAENHVSRGTNAAVRNKQKKQESKS
jgi:hypothetical protein